MNEIPCKLNKCLILPACKNKTYIYCNDLYKWILENSEGYPNNFHELLSPIEKELRQLEVVRDYYFNFFRIRPSIFERETME